MIRMIMAQFACPLAGTAETNPGLGFSRHHRLSRADPEVH